MTDKLKLTAILLALLVLILLLVLVLVKSRQKWETPGTGARFVCVEKLYGKI